MNSPMAVRNFSAPVAAPVVFVGRITEHTGRLVLMKGQGSGMIRLVWNISRTAVPLAPVLGSMLSLRSGNDRPLVGSTTRGRFSGLFRARFESGVPRWAPCWSRFAALRRLRAQRQRDPQGSASLFDGGHMERRRIRNGFEYVPRA